MGNQWSHCTPLVSYLLYCPLWGSLVDLQVIVPFKSGVPKTKPSPTVKNNKTQPFAVLFFLQGTNMGNIIVYHSAGGNIINISAHFCIQPCYVSIWLKDLKDTNTYL